MDSSLFLRWTLVYILMDDYLLFHGHLPAFLCRLFDFVSYRLCSSSLYHSRLFCSSPFWTSCLPYLFLSSVYHSAATIYLSTPSLRSAHFQTESKLQMLSDPGLSYTHQVLLHPFFPSRPHSSACRLLLLRTSICITRPGLLSRSVPTAMTMPPNIVDSSSSSHAFSCHRMIGVR